MRNTVKLASLTVMMVMVGVFMLSFSGCSIFRATGHGVSAVGQGAGDAISGTGQAIVDGANDTEDDLRRKP
jgi:hypothetical protein